MAGQISRMHAKPATATALTVDTDTPFWVSGDTATPVMVRVPGGGKLNGKAIRVVASGYVTGATTTNATVRLAYGTSATGSSNTIVEASTARAVNSTTRPFQIEAVLVTDSVVKTAVGRGTSQIGNTLDAWAALDNTVTIDPDLDDGTQAFVCSVEFSEDSATNAAFLKDFFLEVLG